MLTDLTPVSMIMTGPLLLVTRPDLQANTLKDLVTAAQEKPDGFSFASSGNGSSTHLGGEMLNAVAGIRSVHVPYKGSGPALTDVIGGQVSYMLDTTISAVPFVKSGKLKALAITSKDRSSVLPQVPTVAEQGYPDFEAVAFVGLMAPIKTPAPTIAKLNADLKTILTSPEIKDKLAAQGFDAEWMSSGDFGDYLQKQVFKWGAVVKSAGVKLD